MVWVWPARMVRGLVTATQKGFVGVSITPSPPAGAAITVPMLSRRTVMLDVNVRGNETLEVTMFSEAVTDTAVVAEPYPTEATVTVAVPGRSP